MIYFVGFCLIASVREQFLVKWTDVFRPEFNQDTLRGYIITAYGNFTYFHKYGWQKIRRSGGEQRVDHSMRSHQHSYKNHSEINGQIYGA